MSLVEEYYELNETEEVSATWKGLQISFYACAACLGLGCGFTMAVLRLTFDDRCYLFTRVPAETLEVEQDQSAVNWESDTWCDYYQFTMVSSFILAIIWATFFLMCGKGGKSPTGLPQPWRIVWPSLIFNFIFFLIALTTAASIQQGTNSFCGRDGFRSKAQAKSLVENCEPLKLLLKKDLSKTALQIEVVVKTSWGCAAAWLVLFLLCFFRIVFVVDFHLYKICVFKVYHSVQNKKEEILRITNYEEPKKLFLDQDEVNAFYFESEESRSDLEAGTKNKGKLDRKLQRQRVLLSNRSPLPYNAAFYVMADIRMLTREKKRDKSTTPLNKTLRKLEMRKLKNVPSSLNVSIDSEFPRILYQRSRRLHRDKDDVKDEKKEDKDQYDDDDDDDDDLDENNDDNDGVDDGYDKRKSRKRSFVKSQESDSETESENEVHITNANLKSYLSFKKQK